MSVSDIRVIPPARHVVSHLPNITGPIRRQESLMDIPVERRMRPIPDAANETVLHRIEVDVVDVAREVVLIPNGVLPKSSLP